MTLIDPLRPEHRRLLRRLRKRIANRENMRRYRSDINYMQLCPGVDLPLDAGTCGRLISPESTRCAACRKRRNWLLQHALNPVEVTLSALLEGAEADDDGAREDFGQAVPLLDALSAQGDPLPALVAPEPGDPVARRHRGGREPRTPAITSLPSSRPSTNSPTSGIPAFVGEDSRARRTRTCPVARLLARLPQRSVPTSR